MLTKPRDHTALHNYFHYKHWRKMKHIYAVKDLAVQAFGLPFFVRAKGEALRSFQDEVNGRGQQNSAIAAHPEDYELYELGTYDEDTGHIEVCRKESGEPELQLVARAKDLLTTRS